MADLNSSKSTAFWVIVLVLLLIVGSLVMFRDVLTGNEGASNEPQPPSPEWTTAPEGGVEVNLPETPMRVTEPEDGATAEETPSETE